MNRLMKQMILGVILVCLVGVGISRADGRRHGDEQERRFFTSGNFYVYGMSTGSYTDQDRILNDDFESDDDVAMAPVVGFGYRMLNVRDYYYLNLEFDFMPVKYHFDYGTESNRYYTAMLVSEVRPFRRSGFSFFFGLGGSLVDNSDENFNAAMSLGIKGRIVKNLYFRAEARAYGEFYDEDHYHCGRYYCDQEEDGFQVTSAQLSVGLELHF